MRITVLTVHYRSFDFVKLMHDSLAALAREDFKMLICDNGPAGAERGRLNRYFEDKKNVEIIFRDQGDEQASVAHARAMDLLLSRVETEFALVMDSDCVLLQAGWDRILIDALGACELIGSVYQKGADYAGFRADSTAFPLPFIMFLRHATYASLGVSFMPGDRAKGQDTAWQLKGAYEQKQLPYRIFDSFNTRYFSDGPFASQEGVYEYYYQGKLIGSHFGRGSTAGIAKYFRAAPANIFFNVFRWLKGLHQMRLWIETCRGIVEKEVKNGAGDGKA
ncbi:MAG: glycosyltransferase [Candidatus Omnitrophota bacterium]